MTKPTSTAIAETGNATSLPALLDRAASALAAARTSGEVLEARDLAAVAYDAAKSAGRMARAKQAHDDVIGAVYRAQADAALIEARAKIRLADEYDAAQERGEVATVGKRSQAERLVDAPPSAADIGVSRKEIHEARTLRDAEIKQPGVIEKAVSERIESGQEPTKAAIKKAAQEASGRNPKKPVRTLEPTPLPDDDYLGDESLEDIVDELQKENEELHARIRALTADDTTKELEREIRTRQGIEARLAQEMDRANRLDRELRSYGKWMAELRKLLRVDGGRRELTAIIRQLVQEAHS